MFLSKICLCFLVMSLIINLRIITSFISLKINFRLNTLFGPLVIPWVHFGLFSFKKDQFYPLSIHNVSCLSFMLDLLVKVNLNYHMEFMWKLGTNVEKNKLMCTFSEVKNLFLMINSFRSHFLTLVEKYLKKETTKL